MNKLFLAMIIGSAAVANAASADGFVCQTIENDLNIRVFNYVQPSKGTRNAAIMVLSDPSVQSGSKTIARFTEVDSTLSNTGATYVAEVNPKVPDTARTGEYLVGTRLGAVDTIVMDLAFSYNDPRVDGESVDGTLSVNKRDGTHITRQVQCERYKKHK